MSGPCAPMEAALSARADGEDPGMDADVVDAHLASCEACGTFVARTEELRWRVDALPAAVPPPDLGGRILAAVPAGPAPRRRFSGRRPVSGVGLTALGAVAAVILIAAFVGGRALAGGGSSGTAQTNSVASVQQVAGSNQQSSNYPGATVLPSGKAAPKPDATLIDTSGQAYNIAAETQGKVALVYFGYTHCPDVCPLNMQLAASALAGMPASQRQKLTVIFVTTDPARDTPGVIRSWLNNFSTSFVGLTGTEAQIQQAEKQIGMPLSTEGAAVGGDGYSITHAGYTLVYSQDNMAHLQLDTTEAVKPYTTTVEHLIAHGFQS